jgi:ABC-type branched-subunit amino acid transport system substrate-binding protein
MSLSDAEILQKGGDTVEGMSLASPCLAEKSDYMKKARKRWQQEQEIGWRVATSYDATQAFIKAIRLSSTQPTREEILKNLKSLKLLMDKTSGFGLSWDSEHSNANRKYCLFEIRNHKFEKILEK